ncbi:MAG TPA: MMPL family transporter [Solirubrobacterales bacterium]|nr:MMPL family transporter [Solirubrobacterales bacterium]
MADRESRPTDTEARGLWRGLARAIVWLRFLIVVAWIAGVVVATIHLPSAFESESSDAESLVPHSSEAVEVEEKADKTFGTPLISRTMAVAGRPQGFSGPALSAVGKYIAGTDRKEGESAIRAVPLVDMPGLLASHQTATTLVVYLYIPTILSEDEQQEAAEGFAAGLGRVSGAEAVKVTGSLPGTRAENDVATSHILWVEIATAVLVVAILAFYFGSLWVPLLALATVGLAYLGVDRALGWAGGQFNLSFSSEVEPVIIGLLFGVLTDYLVFFVSGYRDRLRAGTEPLVAVTEVTAELLPVILAAALMIAGATLTLLISGVHLLAAFGPAMAIAVAIAAAIALTLVPAALAIFGRALLWPRGAGGPETASGEDAAAAPGMRGRLIGGAIRVPALTAILCVVALGAGATGLSQLALGNPVMRGLPPTNEVHQGYDLAAAGLGAGVLGPTMVVVEGEGVGENTARLAALETALGEQEGVSGVLGPAAEPLPGEPGLMVAPGGDAARYLLVLDGDPDGARASQALSEIEENLPELTRRSGLGDASVGVTGDTTIATELTEETWSALERVAPAAIAVLLLLLWVLLRSWTAPLYLVAVSVLVVAAALGITVYVFQDLLGYGELAFIVPVAAAILLLALGADYNVFLISRIWDEAERAPLKPAIRSAGVVAGRAITVAGLILALSFAAVMLIPIQSFREIGFALFVGLLLDTLIARTLLIPALVAIFGRDRGEPESEPEARQSPAKGAREPA